MSQRPLEIVVRHLWPNMLYRAALATAFAILGVCVWRLDWQADAFLIEPKFLLWLAAVGAAFGALLGRWWQGAIVGVIGGALSMLLWYAFMLAFTWGR